MKIPKQMTDAPDTVEDGAVLLVKTEQGPVRLQYFRGDGHPWRCDLLLLHRATDDKSDDPDDLVRFGGELWRRSPFVVHSPLLHRSFEVQGIEVLGRAADPPDAFLDRWRRPTEALDYLSGRGPWRIGRSEDEGSRVFNWLASDLAAIGYSVRLFPSQLGSFCHEPELHPEYEINERAIRYGRQQEAQGQKPSEILNPMFEAPPYPRISARKAALRAGDVLEVPSIRGYAYFQVTPYELFFGKLLRVFEGYWEERPDPFTADLFRTKYLRCCPYLRTAVEEGLIQKVKRLPLVEDAGEMPVLRNGSYDLTRGRKLSFVGILPESGILSEEHAQISPSEGVGDSVPGFLEYLDWDWRPETDLRTQAAIALNRRILATADEDFLRKLRERGLLGHRA